MRTALLAAALLLATSPLFAQADDEQVQRRHKATTPSPGEIRTVSVGEVAFAEFDQTEYLWAELKSDIVAPGQGVILKKGDLLWGAEAEGSRREFCDVDLPGQFCFTDEDGNGTFDKARVVGGSRIPSVSTRYQEVWKAGRATRGRSPLGARLSRRGWRRSPVLGPGVSRRSRPALDPERGHLRHQGWRAHEPDLPRREAGGSGGGERWDQVPGRGWRVSGLPRYDWAAAG